MRKVTKEVCTAFINGERKTVGNTTTDGERLWLHGNLIARKVNGTIEVTMAGWATPTTKERLNGIIDLLAWDNDSWRFRPVDRFHQSDFVQYYGDDAVDSTDWINIGTYDLVRNYPF